MDEEKGKMGKVTKDKRSAKGRKDKRDSKGTKKVEKMFRKLKDEIYETRSEINRFAASNVIVGEDALNRLLKGQDALTQTLKNMQEQITACKTEIKTYMEQALATKDDVQVLKHDIRNAMKEFYFHQKLNEVLELTATRKIATAEEQLNKEGEPSSGDKEKADAAAERKSDVHEIRRQVYDFMQEFISIAKVVMVPDEQKPKEMEGALICYPRAEAFKKDAILQTDPVWGPSRVSVMIEETEQYESPFRNSNNSEKSSYIRRYLDRQKKKSRGYYTDDHHEDICDCDCDECYTYKERLFQQRRNKRPKQYQGIRTLYSTSRDDNDDGFFYRRKRTISYNNLQYQFEHKEDLDKYSYTNRNRGPDNYAGDVYAQQQRQPDYPNQINNNQGYDYVSCNSYDYRRPELNEQLYQQRYQNVPENVQNTWNEEINSAQVIYRVNTGGDELSSRPCELLGFGNHEDAGGAAMNRSPRGDDTVTGHPPEGPMYNYQGPPEGPMYNYQGPPEGPMYNYQEPQEGPMYNYQGQPSSNSNAIPSSCGQNGIAGYPPYRR